MDRAENSTVSTMEAAVRNLGRADPWVLDFMQHWKFGIDANLPR